MAKSGHFVVDEWAKSVPFCESCWLVSACFIGCCWDGCSLTLAGCVPVVVHYQARRAMRSSRMTAFVTCCVWSANPSLQVPCEGRQRFFLAGCSKSWRRASKEDLSNQTLVAPLPMENVMHLLTSLSAVSPVSAFLSGTVWQVMATSR